MFFDTRHRMLAARRQQLLHRSAVLRGRLADDAQVLRSPLALVDQVRRGWHWLKAHPRQVGVGVGAGVAVLLVWRPRRVAWLAGRLWAGWRFWRRLHRWRDQLAPWASPLLGLLAGPLAAKAGRWQPAAPPSHEAASAWPDQRASSS